MGDVIPIRKGFEECWVNYFEPYIGDKFTDGKFYKTEQEAKGDSLKNDFRYLETVKL